VTPWEFLAVAAVRAAVDWAGSRGAALREAAVLRVEGGLGAAPGVVMGVAAMVAVRVAVMVVVAKAVGQVVVTAEG